MSFRTRIVTLALGVCLLAGAVTAHAGENIFWDGNILWNNSTNPGAGNAPYANNEGPTATCAGQAALLGNSEFSTLFGAPFTHNRIIDPQLINLTLVNPVFRPVAGSPVFCSNFHPVVTVPNDGFFTQTDYAGALDASPAHDWTAGWTSYSLTGNPADYNLAKPLITLSGHLATQTLVSTNNYLLLGRVFVGPGVTITVQPGTAIFGSTAIVPSFLEVDRGGKLISNGTATQPIIWTSENAPAGTASPGDWGGVVMNGRACANCAATDLGDSCAFETGTAGFFGGTDDHDNSGSITYNRFEFCGFAVALNAELNCFTMNALGDATVINHNEALRGFDDLFEWFGGTCNAKYLIGLWGDDDGFDYQMGWRGKLQFGIIQQNPDNITVNVDKGIEADNNEFNFGATLCRSNPSFANLTLIGTRQQDPATTKGAFGVHFRRGAHGTVINSIVQGFRLCAFNYDDDETVAAGFAPNGTVYCSGVAGVVDGPKENVLGARAWPNPFAASSRISFNLPSAQKTTVKIYSLSGQLVDVVASQNLEAGSHDVDWTAPASIGDGIYFYTVEAGQYSAHGKLVRVRS